MRKVAVFGKPGSGKSTFSRKLSHYTGLPLYPLDLMTHQSGGVPVDREVYDEKHRQVLSTDAWIIEGLGPIGSFYQRLEAADTLIYIDLPYSLSYYLVTKRLLKGLFISPEGWPERSPLLKGTVASYKMLKLSPTFWNDDLSARLAHLAADRALHILTSLSDVDALLKACQNQP